MKTKKNDFVEIEFIGKNEETGEIFDTNIKEEAEKINLKIQEKPMVICIGSGMLVSGFDNALEGKEIGKKYKILLPPEKSFGKRNSQLIKLLPMRIFREKNINPIVGMVFNFDGAIAKIISVSGGRIIVDFNNPLAGKNIQYEFKIKKQIKDLKEKINALQDFFFKNRFEFNIADNEIIFEEKSEPFMKFFKNKFSEIIGVKVNISKETEDTNKETKNLSKKTKNPKSEKNKLSAVKHINKK